MWEGRLEGIFVTADSGGPLAAVLDVEAVAGVGLRGDRYATGDGTFPTAAQRQVTLIESEALAAAADDYGVRLTDGASRRNLVTVGVPLNHLVGTEFRVGPARLRGLELCEPCGHLEQLTGQRVIRALRHRGGLNAEILDGGTITVGDPIHPV